MSLLRFLRREKDDRKTAVQEPPPPAPAPKAAPLPVTPVIQRSVAPPAQPVPPPPLDLERIRRELQEIASIVGEEDFLLVPEGDAKTSSNPTIEIRLADVVSILPQAFRNPDALASVSETRLSVEVPDLFDKLQKGKVTTTLEHLIADVPSDHLSDYVGLHMEDTVSLPLHLVVAAIEPGELRKRTAFTERDMGDKALPNLFTASSVAAAAAEIVGLPTTPPPAGALELPSLLADAEAVTAAPSAPKAPEEPAVAAAVPVVEPAPAEPVVAESSDADAVPEHVIEAEPAPVVELEPVVAESVMTQPEAVVIPEPEPVAESVADAVADVLPLESPVAMPAPEPMVAAAADVSPEADEVDEVIDEESIDLPAGEGALAEIAPYKDQPRVLLGGLDVNYATAEELSARLNGLGLRMAQRVVEERLLNGPYKDIFDLARVPGLRRKRFEEVTGVRWDGAYFKYRAMVNEMLDTEIGAMPDVRRVASRFTEAAGFSGCLVIHEDGDVLAGTWDHGSADRLGAFAPQMFKKVVRYVKQLKLGDIRTLSFFADKQPITIIHCGKIFFVALHEEESFTKKQVEMAQALATELGRRLT